MEEKKNGLNQKEKRTLMIVSLVLVLALVFGISYAYFLAQDTSAPQEITTANMGIVLDDGTDNDEEVVVMATNISPIDMEDISTKAAKKTFTITTSGTEKMFVNITLEDITLPTALDRYDFMWSLYEGDKNVSNGTFAGTDTTIDIAPYQVFETNTTKTYNLYIWIEETYLNQNTMMNQTFQATIVATGEVYWESPESDFTVYEETGTLLTYSGSGGNISIPAKIGDVTITSIGSNVFGDLITSTGKNITNVIIPNSVTFINAGAFAYNNLTNIVIPNSVTTIGSGAFRNNQLANIVIPNSVTSIDNDAFARNQLTNVVIPNSVTSIGVAAFENNQLTNVIIPSSVTTLSPNAFTINTNLTEIIVKGKSSAEEFIDASGLTELLGTGVNIVYEP